MIFFLTDVPVVYIFGRAEVYACSHLVDVQALFIIGPTDVLVLSHPTEV